MGLAMVMNPAEVRALHYHNETSLYTGQGIQRLHRHWAFLRQSSSPPLKSVAAATILGPAAVGAVAGKDLGEAVVQVLFSNENEKDEGLKVKAGRYIGAFFGGLFGAAGGAFVYMTGVEQTRQFAIWREIKIYQTLKASTSFNYSDDPILKEHCCPISLFPMIVPALAPIAGNIYYDLEHLLSTSPRTEDDEKIIIDPCTRLTYHEDSLTIDYERGVFINKRIRHLLKADLAQLPKDSNLRGVLVRIIAEVDEIIKNHYDSAKNEIEQKREAGQLTGTAYLTELQRFFAKCGETKEQDLNWGVKA